MLMLAEVWLPRRPRQLPRRSRWPGNLGVAVVSAWVSRAITPLGAVGFTFFAAHHSLGLLPRIGLPDPVEFALTILVLDFAIYLQHRLFHHHPLLWRLHRMHHADVELDATSGSRFHPIEIAASLGFKFLAIALLGPSPNAVLTFEILLNATALFNHSNLRLPIAVDRWLRWLVVTPDMHRVHHSVHREETDSNFGFNLPWWDWIFQTYRPQPKEGHETMRIGLEEFRAPQESGLTRLLTQPFRDDASPRTGGDAVPRSDH